MPPNLLLLSYLALFAGLLPTATTAKPSLLSPASAPGASRKRGPKTEKKNDAYRLLARSIQRRLNAPPPSSPESDLAGHDVAAISSALRSLSATQTALKKIDGTAHEVYQRTHKSTTSFDDGSDDGSDDGEGRRAEPRARSASTSKTLVSSKTHRRRALDTANAMWPARRALADAQPGAPKWRT